MTSKFEIVYLEIAKNDMDQIFGYILKDNPKKALEILNEIDDSISKLSNFPKLGHLPKDSRLHTFGYRVLALSNYLVFYIIKGNEVEIHRILHGSRNFQTLL